MVPAIHNMEYSESFDVKPASRVTQGQVNDCAVLFSTHYGVWGASGAKPGQPVKMSATQLRSQYLFDDNCFAVMAHDGPTLIGHVLFRQFEYLDGSGIWITQLVVHKGYRGRHIASKLLAIAINNGPKLRVAGLATSHPVAVLAFERVMKKACTPALCNALASGVLTCCGVPYLSGCQTRFRSDTSGQAVSIINTNFFVDHSEVDAIRESLTDWKLGKLRDGEEYLVIIFTA